MRKLAAVTVLAATGIAAALAAQAAPPRVGRTVDHVRMVALAVADSAKVIVKMEK